MQRFIFSTISCFYIALLMIGTSNAADVKSKQEIDANFLNQGQVLLRNHYLFIGGQKSFGASTFTVKVDGKIFAVTARHLLGEAMGISPEVKVENFDNELVGWDLVEPFTNQVKFRVTKLADLDYSTNHDLLKFLIEENPHGGANIHALSVSTDAVNTEENYYLIGCPYSEDECVQNLYQLSYKKEKCYNDNTCLYIFSRSNKEFILRGFSGAPIINSKGELVAILSGSSGEDVTAQKYF